VIASLRHLRASRAGQRVAQQRSFYARGADLSTTLAWQLDRFNEQWTALRIHVPYFRDLQNERCLPERFASWQEFSALLPATSRADIRAAGGMIYDTRQGPRRWRSTGGSTGEPLRVPVWDSEPAVAADDLWYARRWFDITPADKLFLIWGHSHLLGNGVAGWVNARRRELKDWILGYHRCSAYRLGDADLRAAASDLLCFQPSYVLGYAAALDRFACVNAERRDSFRALGLKAVIATAESFPRADSREMLADLFHCPVVMEYGAVETGPIAHQRPDGVYQVFWRHYFLESIPFAPLPGAHQILLTSLYPRCLPLVRYQIGDLLELPEKEMPASREFRAVLGRTNDLVRLPGGRIFHSEALTHAIKESPLQAFQVRQTQAGIALRYTAACSLSELELVEVRRRLGRIDAELATIPIEHVAELELTPAGKTHRVFQTN
jgi:phenylacetate-CoA ligase